ncbi:LysR family transcriptional regulator [Marinomonas rhizomae]|uniref:LysR family glycine cleavage system transcriptional activator n=1 Tax=Marinomonas rhizomae TaxID=491948 RepID=A0A366IW24_9GAMM|nr:LysR substrate-binding domain-containing protein [Marinomonas rhizomae]RBP79001.1 LysR family glycine cleavage system transcriptional activator [Marinomonas rhizomae]RNF71226.1 LysR family transcriptional regulator [Marinomonas rhizomae]
MPINNRTIPSLSSLILFEASARLGTLTSAANELCVSPTAVSKQIKQLESFLNTKLFIRKKTGLELTQKGQIYLKSVSQALTLLAEESQKMDDKVSPLPLNLEIGTCFSHFWLIPHLDDFRDKYPDIMLNISINNERNMSEVKSDEYDVAFYYSSLKTSSKNNFLLFNERMLLVCSPSFLTKRPECQNLDNIWQQPLLGLKDAPDFWENWRTWAAHTGINYQEPLNQIQMEDQIAVVHAAQNGLGIALAWDWHIKDLITEGSLVALTPPIECNNNAFFLTRTENANQYSSESFINWVMELVANQNHSKV